MPFTRENAKELAQKAVTARKRKRQVASDARSLDPVQALGITEMELAEALALIRRSRATRGAAQGVVVTVGPDGRLVSNMPDAKPFEPRFCDCGDGTTPVVFGKNVCAECDAELRGRAS